MSVAAMETSSCQQVVLATHPSVGVLHQCAKMAMVSSTALNQHRKFDINVSEEVWAKLQSNLTNAFADPLDMSSQALFPTIVLQTYLLFHIYKPADCDT